MTKRWSPWIVAALAACSSGGATKPPPDPSAVVTPTPPAAPSMLSKDDAILETVLVHEIDAASPRPDEPLCIYVRNDAGKTIDPSAELIAAIQKRYPNAGPRTRCSGGGPEPVTVTADGRGAMGFDVGPVKWDGAAALVEGGGGSRGGVRTIREVEYRVEAAGTGWKVASERVVRQM
ncbi:MAG: hypothetical protein JNL83_39455 [Myxococcales bacterium]|nr:hypothetical protein [Myxococcales bacterium]